jgi:hypothetical protein
MWGVVEDFPLLGIYKFDFSGMRFQTSFGGGNLNVNDFHHQTRFGIWNETVDIWNSKWKEVLQYLGDGGGMIEDYLGVCMCVVM